MIFASLALLLVQVGVVYFAYRRLEQRCVKHVERVEAVHPAISKKTLAVLKESKLTNQAAGQATRDADEMLVKMRQALERTEEVEAKMNQILADRRFQHVLNSL